MNDHRDNSVKANLIFVIDDEVVMKAFKATMACRVEEEEVIEVQDQDIVEEIDINPPRLFNVLGRNAMGPQ